MGLSCRRFRKTPREHLLNRLGKKTDHHGRRDRALPDADNGSEREEPHGGCQRRERDVVGDLHRAEGGLRQRRRGDHEAFARLHDGLRADLHDGAEGEDEVAEKREQRGEKPISGVKPFRPVHGEVDEGAEEKAHRNLHEVEGRIATPQERDLSRHEEKVEEDRAGPEGETCDFRRREGHRADRRRAESSPRRAGDAEGGEKHPQKQESDSSEKVLEAFAGASRHGGFLILRNKMSANVCRPRTIFKVRREKAWARVPGAFG